MGHECRDGARVPRFSVGKRPGVGALRRCAGGAEPRRICRVVTEDPGRVVLHTRVGSHRLLERLSGEQLPRIC
jgi:hydrogenase expression/formation protein HypE